MLWSQMHIYTRHQTEILFCTIPTMKLAVIFLFVSVVIATPSGTKPILERASGTESALRPRDTYPVVKAISRDPAVNGTFLTGLGE